LLAYVLLYGTTGLETWYHRIPCSLLTQDSGEHKRHGPVGAGPEEAMI